MNNYRAFSCLTSRHFTYRTVVHHFHDLRGVRRDFVLETTFTAGCFQRTSMENGTGNLDGRLIVGDLQCADMCMSNPALPVDLLCFDKRKSITVAGKGWSGVMMARLTFDLPSLFQITHLGIK